MLANFRAVAITVSDTRNETNDVSGKILSESLRNFGITIVESTIVSDDLENLVKTLERYANVAHLIITTGGTGLSPRDNTPEATKKVIEKEIPGFAELMRIESAKSTKFSWFSRGICGIKGNCLIINFPGSPKAVRECFEILKPLLKHSLRQINGIKEH